MMVETKQQQKIDKPNKKEKKTSFIEILQLPQDVSVSFVDYTFVVSHKDTSLKRVMNNSLVKIQVTDKEIKLTTVSANSREKKMLGTTKAHIKNMLAGVVEPFIYKLKVCSGHFPMNVAVSGNKLVVKNFFSEKVPREVVIPDDAKVEVKGDNISVTSPDKEVAGRCASSIEQLTRRSGFDRRVFQDGIYIVEKGK